VAGRGGRKIKRGQGGKKRRGKGRKIQSGDNTTVLRRSKLQNLQAAKRRYTSEHRRKGGKKETEAGTARWREKSGQLNERRKELGENRLRG